VKFTGHLLEIVDRSLEADTERERPCYRTATTLKKNGGIDLRRKRVI
jgi:hypothetical protein